VLLLCGSNLRGSLSLIRSVSLKNALDTKATTVVHSKSHLIVSVLKEGGGRREERSHTTRHLPFFIFAVCV
jgi:hypothetical protein